MCGNEEELGNGKKGKKTETAMVIEGTEERKITDSRDKNKEKYDSDMEPEDDMNDELRQEKTARVMSLMGEYFGARDGHQRR